MHPIAFRLGSLEIHWYGITLSASMALGVALYHWLGKRRGYSAEFLSDACLWMLLGGILGARIDAGIHEWERFFQNPFWILNPREGGFAIHGGIFGGLLGVYLRFTREKVPWLEGMDMGTAVVLPAMALGRLGCTLQGCCYGKMASWGLTYPGELGGPRYPVQLIESGLDLLLWPLVLWVFFVSKRQGQTMWTMLACYGVIRFGTEFFRQEIMWGPLTKMQWGSLLILAVATAGALGLLGGRPRFSPMTPEPRPSGSARRRKAGGG